MLTFENFEDLGRHLEGHNLQQLKILNKGSMHMFFLKKLKYSQGGKVIECQEKEFPCGLLAVESSNTPQTMTAVVPAAGCVLELDG